MDMLEVVKKTEDQYGEYGLGVKNKEEGQILEFYTAINMRVGKILFHKRKSHPVTYESGPSKMQVEYCLVRRDQRKFVKDMKALPSERCITQHKQVLCNFKIRKVNDT